MKKKLLSILFISIMLLTLVISGCGKSTQTTTTTTTPSDSPADTIVLDTEALAAELNQFTTMSNYNIDADPIDVTSIMDGKKFYLIPANLAVPFDEQTCNNIIDICESMGITCDMYAADGTTDSWIAGIETGVNQSYDAILCFAGVNMDLVSSQIEYAESKGIPVIDLHFHDFADQPECGATYCLAAPYELAGRILALWAIQEVGAEGDIAIVTSRDLDASIAMEKGLESAFEDYAPTINRKYINVVLTDWATKIQSEMQNALLANPSTDYVIGIYDAMTTYITAAIDSVGVADSVKCNSYNGSPFALDLINQGKVDMILGEDLECMAYCLLDQCFRIMGGLEPLADENAPFYIWSTENVQDAIGENGMSGYGGYDQSYVAFYNELWGIKE